MGLNYRSTTPVYQQLAAAVVEKIDSGELAPEEQIPSEKNLAREYGVGRDVVRHAMAYLRARGYIYTVPARGSYVAEPGSRG